MIGDLEKLAQLGGTVFTVAVFIWYLVQKDKSNKDTYDKFNITISNHLDHSTKVIEKNTDAYTQIVVTLKELCILMKKNTKGEKGDRGRQGGQGGQGGQGEQGIQGIQGV